MKTDKERAPTEKQKKQAIKYGVTLTENDTIHSACQKINPHAQAELDARKKKNSK